MKKINKKQILPIVLYVFAILIAVYSIFTIYTTHTYISSLVETGSVVIKDQLVDVISYYVSASMPYVFYAVVVWAIGYIISKLNYLGNSISHNKEEKVIEN